VMMAYNLMSLFRQAVVGTKVQHFMKTLRYKVFAIGGYMDQKGQQQDIEAFPADEKKRMVHRVVEFSRTHELAFCRQDLNPNDGFKLISFSSWKLANQI